MCIEEFFSIYFENKNYFLINVPVYLLRVDVMFGTMRERDTAWVAISA